MPDVIAKRPNAADYVVPDGRRVTLPSGDLDVVVASIFKRVLHIPSAAPDADFFELGGDSILALRLLLEVERVTGCKLPSMAVYDAPTIAGMVELLRGEQGAHQSLVLLKPGKQDLPPLFLAHGLGATAMEVAPLARALDIPNPVYCLEAPGLDGASAPLDTIEEMAAYFLDKIRKLQPHGPYLLSGECFGGIVAFELAQQMSRLGEPVALLALLGTFPHARYWPICGRIRTWFRLVMAFSVSSAVQRVTGHHIPVMRGLPKRQIVPYLLGFLGHGVTLPFRIFGLSGYVRTHEPRAHANNALVASEAMERVRQAAQHAFARYRPRPYAGELFFLHTQSAVRLPFDGPGIWRKLTVRLNVVTVRGDRQEMLGTLLPVFAGELARLVRTARRV